MNPPNGGPPSLHRNLLVGATYRRVASPQLERPNCQSQLDLSRASKWAQALQVDIHSVLGTEATPPVVSPQAPQVPLPAPSRSPTPQASLFQLTRTIHEAREAASFHPTVEKGRGRGNWWSGGRGSSKRPRDADASTRPESDNSPAPRELANDQPAAPQPKVTKKKTTAKGNATTTEQQQLTEAAKNRTLFRLQPSDPAPVVPSAAHASTSTSDSFQSAMNLLRPLDDDVAIQALIADIQRSVQDPNRIQAPLLGVSVVTTDLESNFSMALMLSPVFTSARGGGNGRKSQNLQPRKPYCHADTVSHRSELTQRLLYVLFIWDGVVFRAPLPRGAEMIRIVASTMAEVDIITFYAPSVYFSLFAHFGEQPGDLRRAHALGENPSWVPLADVQVMAWMLNPSEPCSDYDQLVREHLLNTPVQGSVKLSAFSMLSLEGAVDRLNQLLLLYRRMYASMGARGLLQPFSKQERHITMLCARMKFDGFCVDASQVETFRERANAEMISLQSRALSAVKPMMSTFNLASPDDCRQALYGVLQLDRYLDHHADKTKSGKLSTAEDTLLQLTAHHELPGIILAYRKIAKLLQTYVEGILEAAAVLSSPDENGTTSVELDAHDQNDTTPRPPSPPPASVLFGAGLDEVMFGDSEPETNEVVPPPVAADPTPPPPTMSSHRRRVALRRVHATFFQQGTDTGRLSCFDPNLQNLPRCHDEESSAATSDILSSSFIRRCFIAHPMASGTLLDRTSVLISADFEQMEIRILAHLCGDAALVQHLMPMSDADCNSHCSDIHRSIAASIFRKSPSGVSKEERTQAKRIVFGVLYGMGIRALAAQLNESPDRVTHIHNLFRQAFPHIERYQQRVISSCRQHGLVRTISNRVRLLPDINNPSDFGKRSLAERQAFNTVIQGSAADVVKRSMISVYQDVLCDAESFHGHVQMVAQIHDELIFSAPAFMTSTLVPRIVHSMANCMALAVPLKISVGVGVSLGSLQSYPVS